jgi:hypothetical protein
VAQDRHIYGEVNRPTSLKGVFREIRKDVEHARSRPALSELYKLAGYLITLTHVPAWRKKFGPQAMTMRRVAKEEFHSTARKINRRAEAIGAKGDYDTKWGPGR